MGHKKTYTDAIAEVGHKDIKDLVWKKKDLITFSFLWSFHLYVVSVWPLFWTTKLMAKFEESVSNHIFILT